MNGKKLKRNYFFCYYRVFLDQKKPKKAKLVLEDGSVFEGTSFGAEINSGGEVVFSTGMVGYEYSLTDPSYEGQILCMTYPLVGNYGVPKHKMEDGLLKYFESNKVWIKGLVVVEYSEKHNHWNSEKSLGDWLKEEEVPAITGIDVRALTKKLREHGTMLGRIEAGKEAPKKEFYNPDEENLVENVSTSRITEYGKGKKIALLDCGVKNNIIRCLVKRGAKVIRVPWDYDIFEKKLDFDGVLISNGPGDPKKAVATIKTVTKALEKEIPIFGVCLGNQILALAAGGDTYKLKYGHRSANQPCRIVGTERCYITSQNHGFAVNMKTLGKSWKAWFENVNDGTNEGIRHKGKPFMAVQFHPEANPGPVDTEFLFDEFLKEIK